MKGKYSFFISHLLLLVLVILILIPGLRSIDTVIPFLVVCLLIELFYLYQIRKGSNPYQGNLMVIIWLFFIIWEVLVSKLDLLQPVLFPAPENVFNVFATQSRALVENVFSSTMLLAVGCFLGIVLGVLLGLPTGWIPRLKGVFFPIAQVLAPIPPIIYAPYLIALMPTFRSASIVVIFLGVFFPIFLKMILQVQTVDQRIIDSAKALNLKGFSMVYKVLLPYIFPSVITGLKITLGTAIMLLMFAEMMGATSGLGYYIINYTHYANYTNVVAGIFLVALYITVLNGLIDRIQKRVIKWR